MKLVLLILTFVTLVLFVSWSVSNDGSNSLATAVSAEYDYRAAILDNSIHAMMRNSAVVSYRKFNHDMNRVDGSLLVVRVDIMHHMRKSLNRLEESVFQEPFIQTSKFNLLEIRSHNHGKFFTKTSKYDFDSHYYLVNLFMSTETSKYDFYSHYLDNIVMPNTARLVAKTIAVRKGVWVVRMEQTLDKLQAELSDEGIVGDLDATHPAENMWAGDILLLGFICIVSYAVYLKFFN